MKGFGRDLPKFQALGAQVLGISYDDQSTQHKFAVHCAADFPFLSDEGGKTAEQYRSAGGMGPFRFAQRRTFVVDRAGVIRFVYDGMPNNEAILKDLGSLKAKS
ncbi:MAG TPA: redoxin domain-containing protein [Stenomitos sp.]